MPLPSLYSSTFSHSPLTLFITFLAQAPPTPLAASTFTSEGETGHWRNKSHTHSHHPNQARNTILMKEKRIANSIILYYVYRDESEVQMRHGEGRG